MNTAFITIPSIAFALKPNFFGMILIVNQLWFILLADWFGLNIMITVSFCYKNIPFSLRLRRKSDIAVLKEVFLIEEYKWKLKHNPKTILDLGAHIGDTAIYYHCYYPDAMIYAVEPDPILFNRLKNNVRNITKIVPIQAAVAPSTGNVILHTSDISSLRGSLTNRKNTDGEIVVPALTLIDLYKNLGIKKVDLCKFDIEGGEKNMFGNLTAMDYAEAYIGEFHGDLIEFELNEFIKLFSGFEIITEPMGREKRFKILATKN